jgi:hypothetical protein
MFTLRRASRDLPRTAMRLYWRLIGRKWMRWLGPAFLTAALVGSFGLALRWPLGWLFFIPQAAGWLAAAVGLWGTAAGRPVAKPLRLAAFAALSQAALVWAWARFAVGRPFIAWRPTRREG